MPFYFSSENINRPLTRCYSGGDGLLTLHTHAAISIFESAPLSQGLRVRDFVWKTQGVTGLASFFELEVKKQCIKT